MRIEPDCIPCITRMAVSALGRLSLSDDRQREIFSEVLQNPALQGKSWHLTSPEIIEEVWNVICGETGQTDLYLQEKEIQNQRVASILPFLQAEVEKAQDPLRTAVHLAIIGNSIDLMMENHAADIQRTVIQGLQRPLPDRHYSTFLNKLKQSRKIVYLGDNSGELIFDKLLMETIQKNFSSHISFVVRSIPIMNDVTRREALSAGIDQVADIVENGVDGPFPGTIVRRCSENARELLHSADLIISKGGGNFDSFEEEVDAIGKDVSFLLLCKCQPYRRYFHQELYTPVLRNLFSEEKPKSGVS